MSRLRIGTCSWKLPSWEGLVCSAAEGTNHLEEYARRYDTVEVNQWFWSAFRGRAPLLPRPSDVQEYRRSVPDDFRFTVRAPNSITLTHFRGESESDSFVPNPHFLSVDLFARFISALDPLRELLGPISFPFEYLNRQKMGGQQEFLQRFGDFLDRIPQGPLYALEIRNPHWLNAAHFSFIHRHDLVPVLLESHRMPRVTAVCRRWCRAFRRCGTVVIRLHGPDWERMERETGRQWNRLVVQRDEELHSIVGMTQELLSAGADVYLSVDNHYEGCAPLTIERIQTLLGGARPLG